MGFDVFRLSSFGFVLQLKLQIGKEATAVFFYCKKLQE